MPLKALDAFREPGAPPPVLLHPLAPLSHLIQHRLKAEEQAGWRSGRATELPASLKGLVPETAGVVLDPDGNLAGVARAAEGLLQPKLVLNAAG